MLIDVYVQVCVSVECTGPDDPSPRILSIATDSDEPIYCRQGDAFIHDAPDGADDWLHTNWDQAIKVRAYEAADRVIDRAEGSDLNPEEDRPDE